MSTLLEKHQETKRLIRILDKECREVHKYLTMGLQYSDYVAVSAMFAAKVAFELYPELREVGQ